MFNFLLDIGNYANRVVARTEFEKEEVIFSTCSVSDGSKPFETAMRNLEYHDGFVVLEAYNTKEEAEKGHTKWIELYVTNSLPDTVEDCCNGEIGQLISEKPRYTRKLNKNAKRNSLLLRF